MSNLIIYTDTFALFSAMVIVGPFMSSYFKLYGGASNLDVGSVEAINCLLSVPFSLAVSSAADRNKSHRFVYSLFLLFGLFLHAGLLATAIYRTAHPAESISHHKPEAAQKIIINPLQVDNSSAHFHYAEVEDFAQPEAPHPDHILSTRSLWFYFIATCMIVKNMTFKVNMSLNSAFAANLSAKLNIAFGSIRFWGVIGFMVSSVILIFIDKIDCSAFLVPQLIVFLLISTCQWLAIVLWRDKTKVFELSSSSGEVVLEPVSDSIVSFNYTKNFLPRHAAIKNCKQELQLAFGTTHSHQHNTSNLKRPLLTTIKVEGQFDSRSTDSTGSEADSHASCLELSSEPNSNSANDSRDQSIRLAVYMKVITMIMSRNKNFIRYIIVFILAGSVTVTGMIFLVPNMRLVYGDEDFVMIISYGMFARCSSEILFYYFSPFVKKHLSHSSCITIAMSVNALKFAAYVLVQEKIPIVYFILAMVLDGPASCLFTCALNELAMIFALEARECVPELIERGLIENHQDAIDRINNGFKATIVALCCRCYDSIGFGLGSVIGGWLSDSKDYTSLWMLCCLVSLFSATFNSLWECCSGRFRSASSPSSSSSTEDNNFQETSDTTSSSSNVSLFDIAKPSLDERKQLV